MIYPTLFQGEKRTMTAQNRPMHPPRPSDNPLPRTFGLLCWNVHKEMGRNRFDRMLHALQEHHRPELVLLQEAVIGPQTPDLLPHYAFASAVNIGMRRKDYGVLTAVRSVISEAIALKTYHRELRMTTRKSLLITSHPVEEASKLTVVNLHAINFVPAALFSKEIERLLQQLHGIDGPLIVAGDFNTWNRKRLAYLNAFATAADLTAAKLENAHHVKKRFAKPLDHLFYRELKLLEASAIDTGDVSDHNPILARFSL